MSIATIVLLAFGLAMDAFAVSVASGLAIQRLHVHHAVRLAVFFGLFQALMPLLGWLGGLSLRSLIEAWDHWIAFVLLSGIGGKMVAESTWMKKEEEERQTYPHSVYVLLVLSIATSIDALAVGLSLSLLNVDIVIPALAIGGTTAVLCFVGTYIGDRFGHLFEQKIEVLGGLILIGIGLRILIQHIAAGV